MLTFALAKSKNKSMSNTISHSGVIESIEDGCVHVRIVQTSACAACKVASHCNAAESKEKLVDVFCDTVANRWTVGQAVTVSTSTQVAARALLLGFGLPFVVMVTVLVGVLLLTHDEGLAALGGITALVPYYCVIYMFRSHIQGQLAFQIDE